MNNSNQEVGKKRNIAVLKTAQELKEIAEGILATEKRIKETMESIAEMEQETKINVKEFTEFAQKTKDVAEKLIETISSMTARGKYISEEELTNLEETVISSVEDKNL